MSPCLHSPFQGNFIFYFLKSHHYKKIEIFLKIQIDFENGHIDQGDGCFD
jgi:hypothetical protein